jgi:hypothetical protein
MTVLMVQPDESDLLGPLLGLQRAANDATAATTSSFPVQHKIWNPQQGVTFLQCGPCVSDRADHSCIDLSECIAESERVMLCVCDHIQSCHPRLLNHGVSAA